MNIDKKWSQERKKQHNDFMRKFLKLQSFKTLFENGQNEENSLWVCNCIYNYTYILYIFHYLRFMH